MFIERNGYMGLSDNKIELVDRNGVVRLRAQIADDDTPWLSLNDSLGLERIVITVNREGDGSIGFRDSEGNEKVGIGVSPSLGSGMILQDATNGVLLSIRINGNDAKLLLQTQEGTIIWPKHNLDTKKGDPTIPGP
jgi:hypothetical protein